MDSISAYAARYDFQSGSLLRSNRQDSELDSKALWFLYATFSRVAGLPIWGGRSLSVSDWVYKLKLVTISFDSLMVLTVVGIVATLGLSPGLCFFLPRLLRWVTAGDADDGPNVNERDSEEARTDPNPDPLRG